MSQQHNMAEYIDAFLEVEPDVRVLAVHSFDQHNYSSLPDAVPEETYCEDAVLCTTVPEPIRLRGIGGTTVFGLNSKFEDDYPSSLIGKVAPEEFHSTLNRVNAILQKSMPVSLKCLLCGCLCCCCTFGLSLGPVFFLNKRTKSRIVKLLDSENTRLYNKLGLNLRLHREQQLEGINLRDYVILIEYLPKLQLYAPD